MVKDGTKDGAALEPESREAGFSLIEIMIGLTILVLGLLALGAAMMTAHRLDQLTIEKKAALSFATSQIERIRGMKFFTVASRPRILNATPTPDPQSAGGFLPETAWGSTYVGNNENAGIVGFRQDLDNDGDPDYFGLNYRRELYSAGMRYPFNQSVTGGNVVTISDPRLNSLTPVQGQPSGLEERVAQVLVRDTEASTGLIEDAGYWVTVRVRWRSVAGQNQEFRMSTFISR